MNYTDFIEYYESGYQVTLPSLYKQLVKDDRMDWRLGDYELSEWHQDIKTQLLKNPPLLFSAYEFEIYSASDMIEFAKHKLPSQSDGEYFYLKIDYENRLVIFAQCGNGDGYAFYYEKDKHNEPAIIRIRHDDESEFIAKNLQDFIFYKLLEIAMIGEEGEPEAFRENLLTQLHTHTPYLTDTQIDCLKEVYQRQMIKDNYGFWVLLSDDEFDKLIDKIIPDDRRGEMLEIYVYT